jgi:hypothetical protein
MRIHERLGVMGGLAIGVAACASLAPPPDYRGSTGRVGAVPQPLLAGPARLLHVNKDETICVAAQGPTHVSWHAKRVTGDLETPAREPR